MTGKRHVLWLDLKSMAKNQIKYKYTHIYTQAFISTRDILAAWNPIQIKEKQLILKGEIIWTN